MITTDYRNLYEKLWLAHALYEASWDGNKYRIFSESAVDHLVDDHDRMTPAWWQYARLQGRTAEFWEFVRHELDIPSEDSGAFLARLWEKWGTSPVQRWVASQVTSNKIPAWPAWIPISEQEGT